MCTLSEVCPSVQWTLLLFLATLLNGERTARSKAKGKCSMVGITKWILLSLIVVAFCASGASAQTISAQSCSSLDVQKALNSVTQDGTTVNIPSGSCSWATTVAYKQIFSTTIQGQTTCSGTPVSSCTDNTNIIYAPPRTFQC